VQALSSNEKPSIDAIIEIILFIFFVLKNTYKGNENSMTTKKLKDKMAIMIKIASEGMVIWSSDFKNKNR
jgi:hypothetical protein